MTEEEWLAARHPARLYRYVERRIPNDRKCRLFAVHCCRRIWDRLPDERCRGALAICERYLEGAAGPTELAAAYSAANEAFVEYDDRNGWETAASAIAAACDARDVPLMAGQAAREAALLVWPRPQRQAEYRWQCRVLRDIFGNPFRPATVDPAWLTSDVLALAQGIYAERAFDRMPILADALQDAGCDSDDILNHCRGTSLTHVRGCWVIDLLTGRT
jgi:hypothetical protein